MNREDLIKAMEERWTPGMEPRAIIEGCVDVALSALSGELDRPTLGYYTENGERVTALIVERQSHATTEAELRRVQAELDALKPLYERLQEAQRESTRAFQEAIEAAKRDAQAEIDRLLDDVSTLAVVAQDLGSVVASRARRGSPS